MDLFEACKKGQREAVEDLVADGADVDEIDQTGRTPLHYASVHGHADIATFLIKKGAQVKAHDNQGKTSLLLACENNSGPTALKLMAHGADIKEADYSGKTAFEAAAQVSLVRVVKLALQLEIDLSDTTVHNFWSSLLTHGSAKVHQSIMDWVLETAKSNQDDSPNGAIFVTESGGLVRENSGKWKRPETWALLWALLMNAESKLTDRQRANLMQTLFTMSAPRPKSRSPSPSRLRKMSSQKQEELRAQSAPQFTDCDVFTNGRCGNRALALVEDPRRKVSVFDATTDELRHMMKEFVFYCGRYDITPGSIRTTGSSVVVLADDHGMADTYAEIFEHYSSNMRDLTLPELGRCLIDIYYSCVGCATTAESLEHERDHAMRKYGTIAEEDGTLMRGRMSHEAFMLYCRERFLTTRKVAIKFLQTADSHDAERALRLVAPECVTHTSVAFLQSFLGSGSSAGTMEEEGELVLKAERVLKDDAYMVGLLDGPATIDFREHSRTLKIKDNNGCLLGMSAFPYGVVQPAAECTLAEILSSSPSLLGERYVRAALREVAESLSNLHARKGVMHGDLTAQNIVQSNGRLKLIDFDGSASILTDGTTGYAGAYFSTAVLPPEMFVALSDKRLKRRYEEIFSAEVASTNLASIHDKYLPVSVTVSSAGKKTKQSIVVKAYQRHEKAVEYPYDLVRASDKIDSWALGCLIFRMLNHSAGYASLLPTANASSDDISRAENGAYFLQAMTWTQESLSEHIAARVESAVARDLLLRLLAVDPAQRSSVSEVLADPFFAELERELSVLDAERYTAPFPAPAHVLIVEKERELVEEISAPAEEKVEVIVAEVGREVPPAVETTTPAVTVSTTTTDTSDTTIASTAVDAVHEVDGENRAVKGAPAVQVDAEEVQQIEEAGEKEDSATAAMMMMMTAETTDTAVDEAADAADIPEQPETSVAVDCVPLIKEPAQEEKEEEPAVDTAAAVDMTEVKQNTVESSEQSTEDPVKEVDEGAEEVVVDNEWAEIEMRIQSELAANAAAVSQQEKEGEKEADKEEDARDMPEDGAADGIPELAVEGELATFRSDGIPIPTAEDGEQEEQDEVEKELLDGQDQEQELELDHSMQMHDLYETPSEEFVEDHTSAHSSPAFGLSTSNNNNNNNTVIRRNSSNDALRKSLSLDFGVSPIEMSAMPTSVSTTATTTATAKTEAAQHGLVSESVQDAAIDVVDAVEVEDEEGQEEQMLQEEPQQEEEEVEEGVLIDAELLSNEDAALTEHTAILDTLSAFEATTEEAREQEKEEEEEEEESEAAEQQAQDVCEEVVAETATDSSTANTDVEEVEESEEEEGGGDAAAAAAKDRESKNSKPCRPLSLRQKVEVQVAECHKQLKQVHPSTMALCVVVPAIVIAAFAVHRAKQ